MRKEEMLLESEWEDSDSANYYFIASCVRMQMSRNEAEEKLGEHERLLSGHLSTLVTYKAHHYISTHAQLKQEPIVYNFFDVINAVVNLIIIAHAQSSTHQCLHDYS